MAYTSFVATVTTPGTIQPLTSVIAVPLPTITGTVTGTVLPTASIIIYQADPGNTAAALIYIGSKSMNVTTRAGIGMALAPGQFSPQISLAEGAVSLAEIYIDATAAAAVKNLFVTVVG